MNDWSMLKKLIWLHIVKGGGGIERTVKGAIVHVTNALAMPAKALSVNVEPIQDLHGYDNPWPAGGGKNKFPTTTTQKSSSIDYSDGKITMHPLSAQSHIIVFPFIGDGTTTYTWSFYAYSDVGGAKFSCDGQPDQGGTGLEADHATEVTTTPTRYSYTGILPSTNTGLRFFRTSSGTYATTATIYIYDIQIEVGSEATSYAPYSNICPISGWTEAKVYHSGEDTDNPDVLSVAFPTEAGTVYGGYVDVVKGELVVDRAILDMASITNWNVDKDAKRIYKIQQDLTPASAASAVADGLICNRFPSITADQIYKNVEGVEGVAISTGSALQFRINGLTDDANVTLAMVIEYFANNSTTVVAKLATPTTYTLTPTQIDMLRGENNLWADAGDLTLTYYADGNASTSEALGILLGGTYNNPGGADDVSDDEALEILLGGS